MLLVRNSEEDASRDARVPIMPILRRPRETPRVRMGAASTSERRRDLVLPARWLRPRPARHCGGRRYPFSIRRGGLEAIFILGVIGL